MEVIELIALQSKLKRRTRLRSLWRQRPTIFKEKRSSTELSNLSPYTSWMSILHCQITSELTFKGEKRPSLCTAAETDSDRPKVNIDPSSVTLSIKKNKVHSKSLVDVKHRLYWQLKRKRAMFRCVQMR